MSSKLIILAALAAAAQASVDKNLAMEARAIVASHTHRQLDSRYLATTPSSAPATTHIKAKCVKGQPSNMLEQNGVTMIVPKTGYCLKTSPASSWLLKCDGTFFFCILQNFVCFLFFTLISSPVFVLFLFLFFFGSQALS
tara:strand:+ start:239 stop:658 length:420 start_codon:yes stop_codon:yes gene_type:complete